MTGSGAGEDLIDRVVDRLMNGQDPDVEGLIARTPDLAPELRDKLRKIVRSFGQARPEPHASGDSPPPWTELGPYKLLSRMGEGGMGTVYLAEHRFLERRVALKLIRPELAASPATRERFHREATRIAKLRHENIVSVYDAGEHQGIAYLAMEVVEGAGLDELLEAARRDGKRLDLGSAVRHARDVALALQCAHEAGIIHRDVKPSNVRVTSSDRALLLDFGLSLADEVPSVSISGQFHGTPQYASPEQIELRSAELDARTDVYSLGVVLYECLTGRAPFTSTSLIQLFREILDHVPPAPRSIDDRVDPVLDGIVMRAIAKRREDRYGSSRELALALEQWLRTRESPAVPPRRRHPRVAITLGAAVVLASGAGGWFVLRDGARSPVVAAAAQPVVLAATRGKIALFGPAGLPFDRRLEAWEPVLGRGTFGADEDGEGVVGVSVDGITAKPYALPPGNGKLRGRVATIEPERGVHGATAGIGVELTDGRVVALQVTPAPEGRRMRLCELRRDASSGLVFGAELGSGAAPVGNDASLVIELAWNGTDVQFDWGGAGDLASFGSLLVPRAGKSGARPSRLLLFVEHGSARFEEWVLEER